MAAKTAAEKQADADAKAAEVQRMDDKEAKAASAAAADKAEDTVEGALPEDAEAEDAAVDADLLASYAEGGPPMEDKERENADGEEVFTFVHTINNGQITEGTKRAYEETLKDAGYVPLDPARFGE